MDKKTPTAQELTAMLPEVAEKMHKIYLTSDLKATSLDYRFFHIRGNKYGVAIFLDKGFTLFLKPVEADTRNVCLYYAKIVLSPLANIKNPNKPPAMVLSMQAELVQTSAIERDLRSLSVLEFRKLAKKMTESSFKVFSEVLMGINSDNLVSNALRHVEKKLGISLNPIIRSEI